MTPTIKRIIFNRTFSPDARAWRARIGAAGSSINSTALRIMDREWFIPLAAEELSAKLLDYNWLVGADDLTGALVKPVTLVSGDFVASQANFVSADYSAQSGLKGNGSSKRVDSKVALSAVNPNNISLIWAGAEMDTTGTRRVISARDGINQNMELLQSTAENISIQSLVSSINVNGSPAVNSAILVTGHDGTTLSLMRNGAAPSTAAGANLTQWTASATINYYCRNNAGSYFDFTNGRALFAGIASSLTTTQAQRISVLIRNTVTALGGPVLY